MTSFKFFLLNLVKLWFDACVHFYWCFGSVEIPTRKLLMARVLLFCLVRICDYNFADFKCSSVDDKNFFTFLALLGYDLTPVANLFDHTKMQRFESCFWEVL